MPSNLDNAKKAYELFLRGDVQTMLTEQVADTARYVISGIKEKMPWSGTYEGKQHIAGFFQTLTQHVEFTGWENREWIEAGDTVIVLGSNVARMRANGKEARGEFAHIMKYDANGKVVMFQEYCDTSKFLAALS